MPLVVLVFYSTIIFFVCLAAKEELLLCFSYVLKKTEGFMEKGQWGGRQKVPKRDSKWSSAFWWEKCFSWGVNNMCDIT